MKRYATLIMAIVALFAVQNVDAQYCTSTYAIGGCTSPIYMSNVTTTGGIENFSNTTVCTGTGTAGYTNYSGVANMYVKQDAGKTVTVKVTIPFEGTGYSGKINVYVDWNQNDTFDVNGSPSELVPPPGGLRHFLVHSSNSGQQSITIPVTVPLEAKNGITRMRIQLGSSGPVFTTPLFPCGQQGPYGETEDYDFEVVNPCLPPNIISLKHIDYKSATMEWSEKKNAEMYEYLVKQDPTPPAPGQIGFNFTTSEMVNLNNLTCGEKYYFFLRCICDTKGPSSGWDVSTWKIDSFTTHQCCYSPQVTIDQITHSTMRVKWNPVPTGYGYEYAVATTNTPPQGGTPTTSTTVFLQGLQGATNYYVFVRSKCSPTPESGWELTSVKTPPGVNVTDVAKADIAVQVFPIPVQDQLKINVSEVTKNAQVTIT
ncbi:MAG: fibronectin type III domain-containing protein, partial [Chitinophagaceae bacterium]|nr:fibronectin type III domain-containing protein [Chitinophagaceae bacterium]